MFYNFINIYEYWLYRCTFSFMIRDIKFRDLYTVKLKLLRHLLWLVCFPFYSYLRTSTLIYQYYSASHNSLYTADSCLFALFISPCSPEHCSLAFRHHFLQRVFLFHQYLLCRAAASSVLPWQCTCYRHCAHHIEMKSGIYHLPVSTPFFLSLVFMLAFYT